tara:strand:- start:1667 stop:3904 length:2238 start_codon:yes stop_codon:yes gene_type:complete
MIAPTDISGRSALTALVVSSLVAFGTAASPLFWHVSTQDDFLRGDVDNLSIDATGTLLLGPFNEVVYEATTPFLWSVSEVDNVFWLGSGNDGRVFRVADNDTAEMIFDSRQLNVHAVTAVDVNSAFVGTSPDGAVFRISQNEEAAIVFDPDEEYIWAITPRNSSGYFYVATGNPGRIYRIGPDGSFSLFYDTNTTHVLSLALDEDENLIAGTGAPGRVFRISSTGEGFVLLDSPFNEIRSVRIATDGTLYAVAVSQSSGATSSSPAVSAAPATATVTVSTSVTSSTVSTSDSSSATSSSTSSTQTSSGSQSGGVYRIKRDGVWDLVWDSTTDLPYDVTFRAPINSPDSANYDLLIGTGPDGKIFQVSESPARVILLARVPTQQVIQFVTTAENNYHYVTANPGRLYRLTADNSSTGVYLSSVQDASTVATWGSLSWQASLPPGTSIELFTRSGNTEEPNEIWSGWSDAHVNSTGSQITSPKARYIQWKAELRGVDAIPALHSVTTAYLPRNLPPAITTVTVHDPGVVFQQPFSGSDPPIAGLNIADEPRQGLSSAEVGTPTNTLGRRVFRKGLQTFEWTAEDANSDELAFDVFYRSESQSTWNTLALGLHERIFTWNTSSVPDGAYVFRIVASDALSNPPLLALQGEVSSPPFNVDNSPPEIIIDASPSTGTNLEFQFTVRDSHSPIERVEFSVGTLDWQVLYPVDGIPDSSVERFRLTLDSPNDGSLVIRATDTMGNTVTESGG